VACVLSAVRNNGRQLLSSRPSSLQAFESILAVEVAAIVVYSENLVRNIAIWDDVLAKCTVDGIRRFNSRCS